MNQINRRRFIEELPSVFFCQHSQQRFCYGHFSSNQLLFHRQHFMGKRINAPYAISAPTVGRFNWAPCYCQNKKFSSAYRFENDFSQCNIQKQRCPVDRCFSIILSLSTLSSGYKCCWLIFCFVMFSKCLFCFLGLRRARKSTCYTS